MELSPLTQLSEFELALTFPLIKKKDKRIRTIKEMTGTLTKFEFEFAVTYPLVKKKGKIIRTIQEMIGKEAYHPIIFFIVKLINPVKYAGP